MDIAEFTELKNQMDRIEGLLLRLLGVQEPSAPADKPEKVSSFRKRCNDALARAAANAERRNNRTVR